MRLFLFTKIIQCNDELTLFLTMVWYDITIMYNIQTRGRWDKYYHVQELERFISRYESHICQFHSLTFTNKVTSVFSCNFRIIVILMYRMVNLF